MQLFMDVMRPAPGSRILDVGGTPDLWRSAAGEGLRVTLLNLPKQIAALTAADRERFDTIAGDACNASDMVSSFDVVFTNSVLEHVGSARRQALFAATINRAAAFWVQVPAPMFPMEVHCRLPLWWLMPPSVRRRLIWRWHRQGKTWIARQMAGTRPISRRRLRTLFPRGRILTERLFGLPKSYYVYHRPD